jgi:neutral ceramidase
LHKDIHVKVAAAQIDITPDMQRRVELSGFVAREQPATGVHDPLFARALYVEADARLLWVNVDVIAFETDHAERLKARIGARFGLEAHEVLLSATHTHSAPATVRLLNCGEMDPEYLAFLDQRILDAAAEALASTEDAELFVGEGHCELAIDRRGKPTKHTDPRLAVLGWRRPDGSFVAVLANYAMHNVALGHENRLISGDMAGRAARRISAVLASGAPARERAAPVVLFTNGGAGNLNPPAVTNDVDQMERWGDELAQTALGALAAARPCPDARVRSALTTLTANYRAVTANEVADVANRHLGYVHGKPDPTSERLRAAIATWQAHMRARLSDSHAPAGEALPIQVVRIGPVVFVALAAEPFSLVADELRRACPGPPIYVVGYANGSTGYLAPRSAYQEGGYETTGAFIFYDRPPGLPDTFDAAIHAARNTLRAILD